MKQLVLSVVLSIALFLSLSTGARSESDGLPVDQKSTQVLADKDQLDRLINEYETSIIQLQFCKQLLLQERERWTKLHSNPVPDRHSLSKTPDGDYQLEITIDTGINNVINGQALTRSINIRLEPNSFFAMVDLLLLATATYPGGVRPAFGVGMLPPFLKNTYFSEVGFGLYSSIFTSGVTFYYTHPKMRMLAINTLVGVTMDGRLAGGIGVSVRF